MSWYQACVAVITEVDKTLPADASLSDRKRALRRVSWHGHQGTAWGKKKWAQASRDYLEHHGHYTNGRKQKGVDGLPLFEGAR
jgi:hypothetical protein